MSKSLNLALQEQARLRNLYRQEPIQTNHLRVGAALLRNVENLAAVAGPNHVGDLTLTFKDNPDPYTAVKRLKRFLRKFKKLCQAYIWALEFGPGCRIHIHVAAVFYHDIRTGFDVAAYDNLKALTRQCQVEDRNMTSQETLYANALKRSLKSNLALKAVQKSVRKLLSSKRMKFGYHFEISPIRKTPEDLGSYYRKNYFAAVRARHWRYHGVHLTGSSRGCPRVYRSQFALINSHARFHYKGIAEALNLPDMADMTQRFGRRWAKALEPVIDELSLWISKDPARWPSRTIRQVVAAHLGADAQLSQ
jgi:hypothetical protein